MKERRVWQLIINRHWWLVGGRIVGFFNGSFFSTPPHRPPPPRGTGSFHQVSLIYIFIGANVCFLSACAFKTPGDTETCFLGQRSGGLKAVLKAETEGCVSLTRRARGGKKGLIREHKTSPKECFDLRFLSESTDHFFDLFISEEGDKE